MIGDENKGVQTRKKILAESEKSHVAFLSTIEPKIFNEACEDKDLIAAMNEELDQIEKNNTWELVPRPSDKNVFSLCMSQTIQSIPDGCQVSISKWEFRRGSVYGTTRRFFSHR